MSFKDDNTTAIVVSDNIEMEKNPYESSYVSPTYEQSGTISETSHMKRGHICCGCCCDVRRAVIIINIINLILLILSLASVPVIEELSTQDDKYDDDNVKESMKILKELPYGFIVTTLCIGILFCFIGFIGAMKYNVRAVMASTIYYMFSIILKITSLDLVGAVITALFMYPHIILIQEMRAGIMTKENYPIEQKACYSNC